MKECKYCRTTYENNLKSCPNCGGTAVVTEKEKVQAEEQEIYEQTIYTDSNKRLRNLILSGVGAIVVIIVIIIIATMTSNSKTYTYPGAFGVGQEITVKEIKDAIDLGDNYIKQGEYLKALDAYKKVPAEYDKYDKVQIKIDSAVEEYSTEVISRVEGLLKDGNYATAISALDEAASFVGNNNVFTLKKDEVLGHYETKFLDNAASYIDAGEYKNALDILDLAIEIIGNSSTLLQKKEDVLSLYKAEFLARSTKHSDEGQYTEALAILTTAQGIFGLSDSDVNAKMIEVHKTKVVEKTSEYEQAEDYATAIQYIEQELSHLNNDTQVVEKLNAYKAIYKEQVLSEAANALERDGYAAAINIVNTGLSILSDDHDLERARDEYSTYAPIRIWELGSFSIDENKTVFTSELKDNYGGIQSNVIRTTGGLMPTERVAIKDFLLDGQYSRLEGTIFRSYDGRTESRNDPWIRIICDGSIVFEKSIAVGKDPEKFSIDLTGIRIVKIAMSTTYSFLSETVDIGGVADLLLYKKW